MKKFFIIIFLLVIGIYLYSYYIYKPSAAPLIRFYYSSFIDDYICPPSTKKRIQPSWHKELNTKIMDLQKAWDKVGPTLLTQTTKTVGKPFSYSKRAVPVFLCPTFTGLSLPMMIPVSLYLKSAVPNTPWPTDEFVEMVYHELLHFYVFKALHWNFWTPLLRKYSNESINVRIHLHLYAVQKAVYLELGMAKDWRMLVYRSKYLPVAYQRAIAIIEKEGYQPFLAELQN